MAVERLRKSEFYRVFLELLIVVSLNIACATILHQMDASSLATNAVANRVIRFILVTTFLALLTIAYISFFLCTIRTPTLMREQMWLVWFSPLIVSRVSNRG